MPPLERNGLRESCRALINASLGYRLTGFHLFPKAHTLFLPTRFTDNLSQNHLREDRMQGRSAAEIRDELNRLLAEEIESMKRQTFGGLTPDEFRERETRLKRIRELSADYLAALKRSAP